MNRLLIANIRNLAGVPSVVFGILGLVVFVQAMRSVHRPGRGEVRALATSPAGSRSRVLVMPIVILVTMEALRAVPSEHP